MKAYKYNLRFENGIKEWQCGLPLGNGIIGALFYGEKDVSVSLDRGDLWDLTSPPEYEDKGFNYANMVKLSKSGKESDWREMLRLFNDCYKHVKPTKINAGSIRISGFDKAPDFNLDIDKAVVSIGSENGKSVEAYISRRYETGVIKLTGDLGYAVEFPEYYYTKLGYAPQKYYEKNGCDFYLHETDGAAFGIVIKEQRTNGGKTLYFCVLNEKNVNAVFAEAERIFSGCSSNSELYKAHVSEWADFWAESGIDIPDKKLEKSYCLSNYFFASANDERGYPMPLQGLWTACNGELPPWKGDYHHDLNTQFTYMSYLRANHIKSGRVFIDYLWNLRETFEKFAKEFYGVSGLLVPAVSTLDGKPLGGWPMYSLSPTMSVWVAKSFDDYYEYTGDETFLKDRAYPFFKEVSDAVTSLFYEKDGKYYLPLSSSPEYGDCTPEAYTDWSNNDAQLVRYMLDTMIKYCAILKTDDKKYRDALSKTDAYFTDEKGVFLLDTARYVEKSHRHHSNLMCIYPLMTFKSDCEERSKIIEANLVRLEELGSGEWAGFSFAWFALLAAMNLSSNRSLFALQVFERCFTSDNGFHFNGDFKRYGVTTLHYKPFTLEANYAFCDGIQTMLLQDHKGYAQLFPCVPDEWKGEKISFEKFLSRGGVRIGAQYEKGKINKASFVADKDTEIRILNTFGLFEKEKDGDIITLKLKKGEEVRICTAAK